MRQTVNTLLKMSKKATSSSLPDRKSFPPIPLGDRNGSTLSSNRDRRPPTPHSRIRKRNPFSERQRNNFPDINDIFKSTTASSTNSGGDNGFRDHPTNNMFDDDDEEEECPFSDIEGSSVLNMSIGARAALNEHARHVAKFGIDGETNVERETNDNNNGNSNSNDARNSETCTSALLDNQWERILDLSRVDSSFGGSVSEGIPSPPNATALNLDFDNCSGVKSRYEESSSSEVMTDVSHDFFNSSRVNLLITPERNKNRRTEMVMTRGTVGDDDTPPDGQLESSFGEFGGEPEAFGYHNENENDTGEDFIESSYNEDRGKNCSDLQGSSFNIGDISRISNNTVSDANHSSLGASFHNYHGQDTSIDFRDDKNNHNDVYALTTILGAGSPSRILSDSSFSAVPTASAVARLSSGSNGTQIPRSGSSVTRISHFQERLVPTESTSSPEKSVHSSSTFQSAVSTFIAEARTFATQIASDVEKSIEGMESLSATFLRGMDIGPTDAPSPISQVLSSPSTSRLDESSTNEQHSSSSSSSRSSSSIDTNALDETGSSIASSAAGNTIQAHLTGRKRYRTVVPRRVYLDSPTQQFNEEQDSFIAVQSNPETTRTDRSLLESFEEAATNYTF